MPLKLAYRHPAGHKKNFSHLLRGRAPFSILNHGWGRGEKGVSLLENESERKEKCVGESGIGSGESEKEKEEEDEEGLN